MCCIAGYFGTEEINRDKLEKCLKLMHRRGPDSAAYKAFKNANGKNVYLLNSRLSIIDLEERSNQPFDLGSKTMVYNGELYNYKELKSDLINRGHEFKTNSDTEVLLSTINHFGMGGLDKCEGMWAFAVYDKTNGSLILSRDRFGEKPLYLYKDNSGIYFGSEVKFITALLGRKLEVNTNHLYRYMVNGYKALYKGEETFYKGLSELSPSNILNILADGKVNETKYWQPKFDVHNSLSYQGIVEGVREKLIKSVELRLRSDVPLAFCMSGGVDSNSLISIAKNIFNYDVHGFTIQNKDKRYEEQDMVEHAVNELKIKHTSIPVDTKNFLEKLKELVKYHDAPVSTITYFAHWLLMESIAKQGYKISISGTAADELFTGYYDHHLAYLYEVRNNPEVFNSYLKSWKEHILPIVRNPFLSNPELFIKNPSFRNHIFLEAEEFSEYLKGEWKETFYEETFTNDLLRNRMLNEMFRENIPVILHEDDLNAMYYSIENRSPYLDRSLFEFSYSIPSEFLMRDGFGKIILRDAMRGIVPDRVLDSRRKVGFNAPIFDFLDIKDTAVKTYLLNDSPIFEHVRRDKIEELIKKSDLPNSQSKFLFYFLNGKIFLEEFS